MLTYLVVFLLTYLVVFLVAGIRIHARTDLGGRDRLQRSDGTEQIPFDEENIR